LRWAHSHRRSLSAHHWTTRLLLTTSHHGWTLWLAGRSATWPWRRLLLWGTHRAVWWEWLSRHARQGTGGRSEPTGHWRDPTHGGGRGSTAGRLLETIHCTVGRIIGRYSAGTSGGGVAIESIVHWGTPWSGSRGSNWSKLSGWTTWSHHRFTWSHVHARHLIG